MVETKVQAGTGAAAVSGLALWALGHYVLKDGVPDVVASWVYVIVPGLLTFGAGYLAKHTPRPGPPQPVLPSNVTVTRPEKTLLPPGVPESVPPATSMPPAAGTLPPPAAPE
jgi:hypothetical protein